MVAMCALISETLHGFPIQARVIDVYKGKKRKKKKEFILFYFKAGLNSS